MVLRLATLTNPSSYYPDEIFQYLEVAHAHVFGYGVETWEQRYGIRSPIFPLILAVPMLIAKWIAPAGLSFLLAAKAMLAFASIGILWGAYRLGRILSPLHGLFAAFATAIWFEFIYFSTQALTEAFALALFFPGAALLLDRSRETRWTLFTGGLLLALTATLRFQYGPALCVFGLFVCGHSKWRWLWMASGACMALLASALVDLSQGLSPYSWLFANFYQNIILSRSHLYSISGPSYYLQAIASLTGITIGAVFVLSWFGARAFPKLAALAVVNIAVHSMIAHKEYRFILLTTAILTVLAAIGTVELVLNRKRPFTHPSIVLAGAAGLWLLGSVLNATIGTSSTIWSHNRAEMRLFKALHEDKLACGIALYNTDWSSMGGYSYLHRAIPLYLVQRWPDAAHWAALTPAFNVLIASPYEFGIPRDFHLVRCQKTEENEAITPQLCVYQRMNGCDRKAAQSNAFNIWLKRHDA